MNKQNQTAILSMDLALATRTLVAASAFGESAAVKRQRRAEVIEALKAQRKYFAPSDANGKRDARTNVYVKAFHIEHALAWLGFAPVLYDVTDIAAGKVAELIARMVRDNYSKKVDEGMVQQAIRASNSLLSEAFGQARAYSKQVAKEAAKPGPATVTKDAAPTAQHVAEIRPESVPAPDRVNDAFAALRLAQQLFTLAKRDALAEKLTELLAEYGQKA